MKKDIKLIVIIISLFFAAAVISALMIFAVRNSTQDEPAEEYYSQSRFFSPDPCFNTKLPDSINYRSAEYDTPYGTFTPIDSILKRNAYHTLNPVVHSSDAGIQYITEGGDSQKAAEIMAEVYRLADNICRSCTDDKSKAYALAEWTGRNLVYDHDLAKETSGFNVISLEAILENDYHTTCGGFSNFYAALCHTQGIYCLNMKGGSSSDGWYRKDLEAAPANHEWNAVAIDGEWHFVDCTWISDLACENGELTGGDDIKLFYALFGFEEMSIEHRIDRCEHRCFAVDSTVDTH